MALAFASVALLLVSLFVGRASLKSFRWWHLPLGIASAIALYLAFVAGDAMAKFFFPSHMIWDPLIFVIVPVRS